MSRLHITPAQFYNLTPLEFDEALVDWNKVEESRQHFELEKMRIQTLYLVNIQLKKEDQIKDARKLITFPWDKIDVYIPTVEDWAHFEKLADKWRQKQSTN